MMKLLSWDTLLVLVIIFVLFLPRQAVAYIGPGSGLSAIGAFLALLAATVAALFGFFWYPIKRLLRRKKPRHAGQGGGGE
jgi:membrane protease YdiL (CAAX protease family)